MLDRPQMPTPPEGCVYGPWHWDDDCGLRGWYCYAPNGSRGVSLWRWLDLTHHGISGEWVRQDWITHPTGPELLRLAEENKALKAKLDGDYA